MSEKIGAKDQDNIGEINIWRQQVGELQRKRDLLVMTSFPGWSATAVMLPVFIKAATHTIVTGEPFPQWVGIAAGLCLAAGHWPFKLAEFAEQHRLKVLGSLERHGEDIVPMLNAGKFPWVRKLFRGQVS